MSPTDPHCGHTHTNTKPYTQINTQLSGDAMWVWEFSEWKDLGWFHDEEEVATGWERVACLSLTSSWGDAMPTCVARMDCPLGRGRGRWENIDPNQRKILFLMHLMIKIFLGMWYSLCLLPGQVGTWLGGGCWGVWMTSREEGSAVISQTCGNFLGEKFGGGRKRSGAYFWL